MGSEVVTSFEVLRSYTDLAADFAHQRLNEGILGKRVEVLTEKAGEYRLGMLDVSMGILQDKDLSLVHGILTEEVRPGEVDEEGVPFELPIRRRSLIIGHKAHHSHGKREAARIMYEEDRGFFCLLTRSDITAAISLKEEWFAVGRRGVKKAYQRPRSLGDIENMKIVSGLMAVVLFPENRDMQQISLRRK